MVGKQRLYESPGEPGKSGFEDLECYRLALQVMEQVHAFSKTLPAEERCDLYAQLRRCAKAVTANLAEGYGRYHYLESLRFYSIARGELNETLAHLINAHVLGYIDKTAFDDLYALVRRAEQALNGFMAYIRRQRSGAQEYGDRAVRDEPAAYEASEREIE